MAMSSLVPGVLFKNTGLNQSHTPTQITATPAEVKSKYERTPLQDNYWPPESPVAQVYDIRNTSSSMILLNNRMENRSHLRVQSGRFRSIKEGGEDARVVEPDRHFRNNSPSVRRHDHCLDSSSPKYGPTPSINTSLPASGRKSHRNSEAASGGGHPKAKEWHHYSSQVDSYRTPLCPPPRRTKSAAPGGRRKSIEPPPCFSRDKKWLQHPDMTYGQKKYMNYIAHTYDVTLMKQLKQAQYIQLIHREQQRGLFTPDHYTKYMHYLNGERKRQFGSGAPPSVAVNTGDRRSKKNNKARESTNSQVQKGEKGPVPEEKRQTAPRSGDPQSSKEKPDDAQYLMYSDPEHPPKQEKKPESPKQSKSPRPKSSKFRERPASTDKDNILSDSESESHDKSKTQKYWTQPPPPVQEKEPDGNGLLMTKDNDLDRDGEALEEISSNHGDDKQARPKTGVKKTSRDQEPVTDTYDIEDQDGNKTRVYSKGIKGSTSKSPYDDTPVKREDKSKVRKPSTQTKRPAQGRQELQDAKERKKYPESNPESKVAHASQSGD